MSPRIYPLTHRQTAAVIISSIVLAVFTLMWLLIGLNILAGGGHMQKHLLFGLLTVLCLVSFITCRSARRHRDAAETLRLLVMMDRTGLRWLYYDARAAAIYDYREDDDRFYVKQDMPWRQILDAYVEYPKYYHTIGKVVVLVKDGAGQTQKAELPLNYFEDKEIANIFVDEMLYMFVITR